MEATKIKLSICIPTFNRANCLGEALESVIREATDEIEIVISDNASTDNTKELVEHYASIFPRITYHRNEKNMGVGVNIAKVIELAKGEYFWLLGSDDRIEKDGISTVLAKLEEFPDVTGFSVNCKIYNNDFSLVVTTKPSIDFDKDTLVTSKDEMVQKLFLPIAYISCLICKKKLWDEVADKNYHETLLVPYLEIYAHLYALSHMFFNNPKWLYISKRCVGNRRDNCSFLKQFGNLERLRIDAIGWQGVIVHIFNKKDPHYTALLNQVVRSFLIYLLIGVKLNTSTSRIELLRICFGKYRNCSKFWYMALPIILSPLSFVHFARFLYRKLIKYKNSYTPENLETAQ